MIVYILGLPARHPWLVLVLFLALLAGLGVWVLRQQRRERARVRKAALVVENVRPSPGLPAATGEPDPLEDTVRIAGSSLPPRVGMAFGHDPQAVEADPARTYVPRAGQPPYLDPPTAAAVDSDTAEILARIRDVPVAWDQRPEVEPDGDEELPQDEGRVRGNPGRDRDGDPPAGGFGVVPVDPAAFPRYTYQAARRWPADQWVPPPGPTLRSAGRYAAATLRAPIRVWRNYSAATGVVRGLRSDLDTWFTDADRMWRNQPWLRRSTDSTTVPARGRHRAAGRTAQRRVAT